MSSDREWFIARSSPASEWTDIRVAAVVDVTPSGALVGFDVFVDVHGTIRERIPRWGIASGAWISFIEHGESQS